MLSEVSFDLSKVCISLMNNVKSVHLGLIFAFPLVSDLAFLKFPESDTLLGLRRLQRSKA